MVRLPGRFEAVFSHISATKVTICAQFRREIDAKWVWNRIKFDVSGAQNPDVQLAPT